jgi:hypothetical protein
MEILVYHRSTEDPLGFLFCHNLFCFLSIQVIAVEAVLGQGNISCSSWIKVVGMTIVFQRPERPGFLAL